MSLSDHESGRTPTCSLCGKPMPPGEEMFKFHGYSGPCPKSTPKEPAPSPVEPVGAADDARHQQEVAISASGNCDDFEATIAELRQDLDEANAVIARYGFGGAKRIEAKLNSEVAWRDDEIKRLKALLKSLEKSTPVAPAGASESPSEMDSGIVLLVSAASAASGYLERQQPDLAAWLWNAVQLVLNSQSAPVSPVEPTPGCGCDLCRAPQGSAILTTIHAPTGEPAPCVWVADGEGYLRPGCTDAHLWGDYVETTEGWQCCPYCEAPLTVER